MPTRPLPNDPSFEHLRKDAKRLRKALQSGDPDARALVNEFHPRAHQVIARPSLADAQLATARSYGFTSWARLKQHLLAIEPFVWSPPALPERPVSPAEAFARLACLDYATWDRSNRDKARRLLADHPEIARANVYNGAAAGDVAAVRAMIESDPSLVRTKGGPLRWEPLLYACYSRMEGEAPDRSTLDVARLLLAHGADPNTGFLWEGQYTFTALTGAFGRGEDNINQPPHPQFAALARLLLDAGADPNDSQTLYNKHFEEDDDHLTLLFAYGLGRNTRGPWLTRMGERGGTPQTWLVQELCWAAMHGFPNRVKLLVEHGVDVNTVSPRDGRSAYQEAVRAGHPAIAAYLLEHGAKELELDPIETFALACIAGRRDEVKRLLADDPRLLEKLGDSGRADMIHRAVSARQADGVRLIVELGVDINIMIPGSGLDRSPLHVAASAGVDMVKLVLDLGGDPALRDPTYHATPIGWANHGDTRDVVDYLMPRASIFDAIQCGGVDRVRTLLQQDQALANAADEYGYPAVFYLHAQLPSLEAMIRALIDHNVDINAIKDGKTRLDLALARGLTEFADILRANGARTADELKAP
jgi:ankyrin repeat protein